MPYATYLEVEPDDDRPFVALVGGLVESVEETDPVDTLVIVRVRGWFGHEWLRFSGKGRVPFESHRLDHPGVSLDPFFQERLTFPPFTPRRILRETHFRTADAPDVAWVHRARLERSAHNLHRRVADRAPSLRVVWVSSGSESSGRASIMVYTSQHGTTEPWYATFERSRERWKLLRVKGIDRGRVDSWLGGAEAPPSGAFRIPPPL